jgi:hypothetical protein
MKSLSGHKQTPIPRNAKEKVTHSDDVTRSDSRIDLLGSQRKGRSNGAERD